MWRRGTDSSFRLSEHVVVLTGAGISAESGLSTFRDAGGLWEQVDLEDVATPEAWARNPELVRDFYNQRRHQVLAARPNAAHEALVNLENRCRVSVVTQNVDNLHERAGSSHVLHLHGSIMEARSAVDPEEVLELGEQDLSPDLTCSRGHPMRPNVVWFGEAVPAMETAAQLVSRADHLLVVGSSLNVYPAASLVQFVEPGVPVSVVDPDARLHLPGARVIRKPATEGVPEWVSGFRAAFSI
ncbi:MULTISPECIES: SIR2 family NAD-dependent protein deacylase [Gammaproteobacteria]|uniref:SIR2 family NAD-dependent protein deacylase n=1 Tax=Gammaproteobacteria TaxID=1236 RepID=UPI00192893B7|nr:MULTISPECIES: Sir2 family NAD-dependent protein deacetylase [Gammaproteobacteria]